MQEEIFKSIFDRSITFLSDGWKRKYVALQCHEHWEVLRERIFSFAFEGKYHHSLLPVFEEEIIDLPYKHYQHFEKVKSIPEVPTEEGSRALARTIEDAPIESLLFVLGQRRTPATISDENGVPPLKKDLLASSFEPYNNQMCKATRARDKHISRNKENSFWGEIEGSPQEKEVETKALIGKIIEEKTWWNVFTHYKQGVVYEIRVASGEGIRWRKNDLGFIGFLEPFV